MKSCRFKNKFKGLCSFFNAGWNEQVFSLKPSKKIWPRSLLSLSFSRKTKTFNSDTL